MPINTDKELHRYSIAVHDFEEAIKVIKESKNHEKDTKIYEALITCAIIYYYRPFSQNEHSKNKTSKAASQIFIEDFKDLTKEELKLHEDCKRIRNKAIAHAEWSKYPTGLDKKTGVISSRFYSILTEPLEWSKLSLLLEKLANQCHNLRADYLLSQTE